MLADELSTTLLGNIQRWQLETFGIEQDPERVWAHMTEQEIRRELQPALFSYLHWCKGQGINPWEGPVEIRADIAAEIADVMHFCCSLMNFIGMDAERALAAKFDKNVSKRNFKQDPATGFYRGG